MAQVHQQHQRGPAQCARLARRRQVHHEPAARVGAITTDRHHVGLDPRRLGGGDGDERILDRLVVEHPRIYGMLLYVEQPFPYDLEPGDNVLKWTNHLKTYTIPTIDKITVNEAHRGILIPIGSVACICLLFLLLLPLLLLRPPTTRIDHPRQLLLYSSFISFLLPLFFL